jgi:YbbR domain-containing protein
VNGYRITAVTITPNTVTITGDPTTIGRFRSLTLPAIDLTGKTSDATFQVAIPYPDGVSGSVSTATIKYSISPNPAVSPTPS